MGDQIVIKQSAAGQPTWPTQPSIPQGSVNEYSDPIRYMDYGVKA